MNINGIKNCYQISQSDCFWNMACRLDENIMKLDIDDIQNKRGVYIFFDWNDKPLRIGKAVKARNRILSYLRNHTTFHLFDSFQQQISYVSVIYTSSETESMTLELDLLQQHKPPYNIHNA